MRIQKTGQGFTLVEIMIVVAIIAILAAIAIPNLLHARMSADDSIARATLRAMSTASENFANVHKGNYPSNESDLTGATPPFLNTSYCANSPISGYSYDCSVMNSAGYTFTATPVTTNITGSQVYAISTGGVLTP